MKILKYLLYIIILIVVIFFAIGIFKKTVSYGSEITVNKPIEEAWAVSQDESKYDQWLEGFKSMELISGEKFQPGSKYKIIVNPGNGEEDFEMIETLISIKENEHIEMHFDSEMMDFEQIMNFSEADGKTTITTESKVMGKGVMMRAMFGTMQMLLGAFDKQEQKNMDALKKLIDENSSENAIEPAEEAAETAIDEAVEAALEVIGTDALTE